jgi:hypothetical protein
MKPRLSAGLGLLVIIDLLSGCAKKGERDYQPLYVGGFWEYVVETSKPVRGQENQVRTGTGVFRIVGLQKIRGRDYFKGMIFFQGLPELTPEAVVWHRRAAEGLYRIDGQADNAEYLFLPLPPKAGQSWTIDQPNGKSVRSIEIEASVDLPERSYSECLKLHIEHLDNQGKLASTETFYFAPGIGCVKGEIEGSNVTIKMRLTKCSLAP